jgi:hypothetical protein
MGWIRSHAWLIAASVIALIVGGGLGAALAGSNTTTRTVTAAGPTTTVAQLRTVTQTHVKTVPTRAARSTGTPSVGAPAGSSPVAPGPPPGPPQHFAGTGPTTLGDITVRGTSTLRWTNTRGRIRVLFDGNAVGVDSTARAGQTPAPPQTYHDVKVDTPGHWTIRIS